jgi:hypothetical protein
MRARRTIDRRKKTGRVSKKGFDFRFIGIKFLKTSPIKVLKTGRLNLLVGKKIFLVLVNCCDNWIICLGEVIWELLNPLLVELHKPT